jgi:riboflavin synthase
VFTGIVREVGTVEGLAGAAGGIRLRILAPETAGSTGLGDSVAVNGVCLTASEVTDGTLSFDAVPETLRRSALAHLQSGARVNLEPALRAGEPLGGHIVQGHVDAVGRVRASEPEGEGRRLVVEVPKEVERYLVEKGSIAVDGVSLTVAEAGPGWFAAAIVPHTLEATTLGEASAGAEVNLEIDVIAKHVERLLETRGGLP